MGDLAAKVRVKYPGVYDDLSDADLEQRILAKYPQYRDMAAQSAAQPTAQPELAPKSEPKALPPGALEQMAGVQVGFAKELPRLALQAANLPRDVISGALSLIADQLGPQAQRADILKSEAEYKARQMVQAPVEPGKAETAGEKAGRFVGRAAPAMALAGATGGATLPMQSAVFGGISGAQSAAEGGTPSQMALAAALGAASPYVGPALSRVIGVPASALRTLAVKQYERGLGATKDAMKAEASRITPELLDRGVSGSLKGLSAKATANVDDIGRQIQAEYRAATQAGTKIDGSKLATGLERLKTPFKELGQNGQEVILNPKAVGAIDEMQGILRELGDTTPSAVWKFRKTVDDIVSASNGFTRELPGGTAKALQKQVRGILQEELNRAVPNVGRLNSEFRLWKALQDVTEATLKRRTSQEGSLIPAILGGSIGGGVAATGSLTGAGGAALLTASLVRALRSPLWRTVSAVQKAKLADVLSGGSEALTTEAGRDAMTMLALFGASTGNALSAPASPRTGR